MNQEDMLVIKVPASTANLGPGFDSIGLALNLYLTLEVELSDKWEVIPLTEQLKGFAKDETNFIVQTALKTAERYHVALTPCRIQIKSDIPLARGLGSSAAAIVAGIELADAIGKLNLSKQRKLQLAAEVEGHPDNVGASLFGGLVIGTQSDSEVNVIATTHIDFEMVALVPKTELLTKDSREVLPSQMSFSDSVRAGSISNVLIASLLSGNYEMAGKMMQRDLYHQPYRRKLVSRWNEIEYSALLLGAFGIALSGAGPTVICFAEKGKGTSLARELKNEFSEMDVLFLDIDRIGSTISRKTKVI